MDNKLIGIILFSILIEGIITYFNQFFVDGHFSLSMLFSIILGVLVSVAYKLDLPSYFNLKSEIKYIGCILTGILLARGSNYIFDLLNKISNI